MSVISTSMGDPFPWYVKLFFWNQKRKYGAILEPALLWGRSPRVFVTLALLYGALDRGSSPLSPALRTLVTVRVSQINGCPFCVDINSATAVKRGITDAKLDSLDDYANSALYNNKEKAALDYAEAVTYSDRQPSDGQIEALRCHFDDEAMIELTGHIGFQDMSSKFNASLGVKPQGFCSIAQLPTLEKQRGEVRKDSV